jgi:hypothetical protein
MLKFSIINKLGQKRKTNPLFPLISFFQLSTFFHKKILISIFPTFHIFNSSPRQIARIVTPRNRAFRESFCLQVVINYDYSIFGIFSSSFYVYQILNKMSLKPNHQKSLSLSIFLELY